MDPIELLEKIALMMRGMTMDPAIPDHTKEALRSAIDDAEKVVEEDVVHPSGNPRTPSVDDHEIGRLARDAGVTCEPTTVRNLRRFAELVRTAERDRLRAEKDAAVAAERERLCAAIKDADDTASEGDYMLDSDDCISVIRGTWDPDHTAVRAGSGASDDRTP